MLIGRAADALVTAALRCNAWTSRSGIRRLYCRFPSMVLYRMEAGKHPKVSVLGWVGSSQHRRWGRVAVERLGKAAEYIIETNSLLCVM